MTNETKESLREEFINWQIHKQSYTSSDDIADWWLSKLDQALKSQKKEIVGKINRKIESYGMPDTKDHYVYIRKVDVLSIIQNK